MAVMSINEQYFTGAIINFNTIFGFIIIMNGSNNHYDYQQQLRIMMIALNATKENTTTI